MNEKIASLEKELLEKKPWQLQGEVTAQKRPENSLLEETLHFDHAVRMGGCAARWAPAPVPAAPSPRVCFPERLGRVFLFPEFLF